MTATDLSSAIAGEAQEALERAVAGAAMTSAANAEALGEIIRDPARTFMTPRHALIFEAAITLARRADPVDPISVLDELTRTGVISKVGGGPYLHDCLAARPADARWHARRLAAEARRRSAVLALEHGASILSAPGFDPVTDFDLARRFVNDALDEPAGETMRSAGRLFADVVEDLERGASRGLSTPWADLNSVIPGLSPGELIIVAARPGTGKSVIGAQLASYVAVSLGLPALLVSLEMSAEQIMYRLISATARVPLSSLTGRRLSPADWDRIQESYGTFTDAPLLIDDASRCSIAHIRSRLSAMRRSGAAARLLVVDYIGLLAAPDAENRNLAVGAISQELKHTAREFEIPVVALAQLNRNPERRTDHRPVPSDLRDSGQLEADADVILLLHRDDMYDPASARAGELEVIIGKQRQGAQAIVTLGFHGDYGRCVNLSRED